MRVHCCTTFEQASNANPTVYNQTDTTTSATNDEGRSVCVVGVRVLGVWRGGGCGGNSRFIFGIYLTTSAFPRKNGRAFIRF